MFNFLDIDKLGSEDELYIKLNSRGRPLTDFENFKARFIDRIKKLDSHLEREFTQKIDTKWNHGAGCTFSASITAEIAKGATVSEAVKTTKELISNALKDSFPLNNFAGPINHKKFALK